MEQPIRIAATSTALPPHEITRDDVKRYFGSTFAIDERRLNAMMAIVDNAQVRRRFFIHPVDTIIEPRPLATLTREYQEHSIALGQRVAEGALQARPRSAAAPTISARIPAARRSWSPWSCPASPSSGATSRRPI